MGKWRTSFNMIARGLQEMVREIKISSRFTSSQENLI